MDKAAVEALGALVGHLRAAGAERTLAALDAALRGQGQAGVAERGRDGGGIYALVRRGRGRAPAGGVTALGPLPSIAPPPRAAAAAAAAPVSAATAEEGDGSCPPGWNRAEVAALRRACATTTHITDKNERFKVVAAAVATHSRRECYDAYKWLKAAQPAAAHGGDGATGGGVVLEPAPVAARAAVAAAAPTAGGSEPVHPRREPAPSSGGDSKQQQRGGGGSTTAGGGGARMARPVAEDDTLGALARAIAPAPAARRGAAGGAPAPDAVWSSMLSHVSESVARTGAPAGGAPAGASVPRRGGGGAAKELVIDDAEPDDAPAPAAAPAPATRPAAAPPSATTTAAATTRGATGAKVGGWGGVGGDEPAAPSAAAAPAAARGRTSGGGDDAPSKPGVPRGGRPEGDTFGSGFERAPAPSAKRGGGAAPPPQRGPAPAPGASGGGGGAGLLDGDEDVLAAELAELARVSGGDGSRPRKAAAAAAGSAASDAAAAAADAPLPEDIGYRGRLLPPEAPRAIRVALYGAPRARGEAVRAFNDAWMRQGFFFAEGVPVGLQQTAGGPCGALAAVQAFLLADLMFGGGAAGGPRREDWATPTPERRAAALVAALTAIIWRARPASEASAFFVLPARPGAKAVGGGAADCKPDGLTERLVSYELLTEHAASVFVQSQLPLLTQPDGYGCVLFIYSVMLTRTLPGVMSDFDTALGATARLISAHNYAAQELVNLLLTGRAHSNVFDGVKVLGESGGDSMTLRGVPSRGSVGMLTLFENYGNVQCGEHFKAPLMPLWVLCSESHYSVLFGATRALSTGAGGDKPFDLYYWDGLARQTALIKLTVNPSPSPPMDEDAARSSDCPPVDLCIRTRWPGATVDWNGVEAWL